MLKLKDLIKEKSEPTDSNQWDNWYEYIKYFDNELQQEELTKLISRFDLKLTPYFDGKILNLSDRKENIYLEYDKENEMFDPIKDINDWIYNKIHNLDINVDNIYNGHLESTLKDFKENPSSVFHYTTEEKRDLIKQSGKMVGSYGTGINNRSAYGIFTTINAEEYQDGTYGNICLQLDLPSFKKNSNIKELYLSYEPEIEEYLIRDYVLRVLEINDFHNDHPSDMSPYTIIVNHIIPIQYIKEI